MIQASAAYLAANLSLQKKPVLLVIIEGYSRAFATQDIGGTYQQSLSLEIPGTAGPWEVTSTLNTAFRYGFKNPTTGAYFQDWSPPVLYPHFFTTGETVPTIGGFHSVDANGGVLPPPGYTQGIFPAWEYVTGLPFFSAGSSGGTLCGAWCDINGRVILPVWIENNGFIYNPSLPGNDASACPAGASILQLGINDDLYEDNIGSIVIDLGTMQSDIVPWLVNLQDMTIAVNELDGGAEHQGFIFNVQDFEGLITADFPTFTFEGKKITLLQGFEGMAVSDFSTLFTGKIDTITADNTNLEYTFSCVDALQNELAKSIYRYSDDGFETSNDHPRTIVGHPIDIFLKALQNEIGLSSSRINLAKLQSFRDTPYNGMMFRFKVTSPPACKDFLQSEICKVIGAYMWTNYLGQVDLNFFYPLTLTPVTEINSDTLIDVPLEEQADLQNQIQFRFDFSEDDDKPLADATNIDANSYGRYGPAPLLSTDARGLRSGFQGFYHAALISRLIFLRFSTKNAMFEDSSSMINVWNPGVLLEPGDLIALTCAQIPDRELGVRGMTEKLFEVCDRTYHFDDLTVGFTLLRISFPAFQQFAIAPDGEPDYPSAGGDQIQYIFMASDQDTYSGSELANNLS